MILLWLLLLLLIASHGGEVESVDCSLGDVKFIVKQGDITRENCDVIVNSTNEKLSMSFGSFILVEPFLNFSLFILIIYYIYFKFILNNFTILILFLVLKGFI